MKSSTEAQVCHNPSNMLSVLVEIVDNGANDLLTLCPSWTMDVVEELKGNRFAARINCGCRESNAKQTCLILSRWWFQISNVFYVHPYFGKRSNLTNIFQMGLKPPTS